MMMGSQACSRKSSKPWLLLLVAIPGTSTVVHGSSSVTDRAVFPPRTKMDGKEFQDDTDRVACGTSMAAVEAVNENVVIWRSVTQGRRPEEFTAGKRVIAGFIEKDSKMLTVVTTSTQGGICLDCAGKAEPEGWLENTGDETDATCYDDARDFQRLLGWSCPLYPRNIKPINTPERGLNYHLALLKFVTETRTDDLDGDPELDGDQDLVGDCHDRRTTAYRSLSWLVQGRKLSLRLFLSILLGSMQKLKGFSKRALVAKMHPMALPLAYDSLKEKVNSGYVHPYLSSMDQVFFPCGDPSVSVCLQPRLHLHRSAAMDMTGLFFAKVAIRCGAISCPHVRDSYSCSGRQPECKTEAKILKILLRGRENGDFRSWHDALAACFKDATHEEYSQQYKTVRRVPS